MKEFNDALRKAERDMHFGTEEDRRGEFDTETFGFSFGGGRKVCCLIVI